MKMSCRMAVAICLLCAVLPGSAQQASLAAAKELYVAAEYAGALSMLNELSGAPGAAPEQGIALYRALCLMALGKTADANGVIESMFASDPLFRPDTTDLPPRVRSAFADARKRLLPTMVQKRYLVARAAYEQQQYLEAADGFKMVLDGLADPDMGVAGAQPPLADLKVLASGFRDLAMKAATPPTLAAAPIGAAPIAPTVMAPSTSRIYGPDDVDVVPPQTIRQSVPAFPGRVVQSGAAAIEVLINTEGRVDEATMLISLSPQYDRMAIRAAKEWQYRPAMLNGTPVPYRKRLQLTMAPESSR